MKITYEGTAEELTDLMVNLGLLDRPADLNQYGMFDFINDIIKTHEDAEE